MCQQCNVLWHSGILMRTIHYWRCSPLEIEQFDGAIQAALRQDLLVDITTRGRKSHQPHRIEIWFHNVCDELFITGAPGWRDWYANLLFDPRLTLHLKETINIAIEASAVIVRTVPERDRIMRIILASGGAFATLFKGRGHWFSELELRHWIRDAPLIRVALTRVMDDGG